MGLRFAMAACLSVSLFAGPALAQSGGGSEISVNREAGVTVIRGSGPPPPVTEEQGIADAARPPAAPPATRLSFERYAIGTIYIVKRRGRKLRRVKTPAPPSPPRQGLHFAPLP